MYSTSQNYGSIVAGEHFFETRVDINGNYYGETVLMSMSMAYRVFSEQQPTVGGCLSAELEVTMLAPDEEIPRMAKVRPYVRAKNEEQSSEWIPQGVFYIDTRETTSNDDGLNILTLHCYDAMLKTEGDYPSTSTSFPKSDIDVVKEIAKTIGLQSSSSATTGIDDRTLTVMNKAYQIGLPVGYSMREVLGNIASMYAGNWIMNYDGKLRLVTLAELPDETNYLVDSSYDAITFGGDKILV